MPERTIRIMGSCENIFKYLRSWSVECGRSVFFSNLTSFQRPKIFGMTASPVHNIKDAAASLATLERNLDSKVVVIRNHVEELVAHGPQVSEVLNTYVLRP